MSDPKRYQYIDVDGVIIEHFKGEYVRWSDYKRLMAEFNRYHHIVLTAHADLTLQNTRLSAENERLESEVEKLQNLVDFYEGRGKE